MGLTGTLFLWLLASALISSGSVASGYEDNEFRFGFDDQENAIDDDLEEICAKMSCGAGRECVIDQESGEPRCECVKECGAELDPRRQVCSNFNETFATDCDLYRTRCLCEEDGSAHLCTEPEKMKHMHIEYYGACRTLPRCQDEELADFPRRMREWLFNVMQELAERKELSSHYSQLEREAEDDQAKRWRNAAIWKWCDLDGSPQNKVVSRHELFPIKAPLQTLEHCIGDFLDSCDIDNDHAITLKEWGNCLEIDADDLEEACEKI